MHIQPHIPLSTPPFPLAVAAGDGEGVPRSGGGEVMRKCEPCQPPIPPAADFPPDRGEEIRTGTDIPAPCQGEGGLAEAGRGPSNWWGRSVWRVLFYSQGTRKPQRPVRFSGRRSREDRPVTYAVIEVICFT